MRTDQWPLRCFLMTFERIEQETGYVGADRTRVSRLASPSALNPKSRKKNRHGDRETEFGLLVHSGVTNASGLFISNLWSLLSDTFLALVDVVPF
jgi:hypothetical protein